MDGDYFNLLLSVFPVYSASSNLEYIVQNGTTTGHVIKHMFFVFLGLANYESCRNCKIRTHRKTEQYPSRNYGDFTFVTMFTGQKIDGASASRWLKIPGTPISFQPSSFAYLMLIIYLCRYLTKKLKEKDFQ